MGINGKGILIEKNLAEYAINTIVKKMRKAKKPANSAVRCFGRNFAIISAEGRMMIRKTSRICSYRMENEKKSMVMKRKRNVISAVSR